MILFGHPFIPSEPFFHIESIEAINHTPSNSIIAMVFEAQNLDIITHLRTNGIKFALYVTSSLEAVLAENHGASYLLVSIKEASQIQSIAEHYLFDAKVLAYCEGEDQLEELLEMRIDGAIFPDAIVKITS